jgi:signal transduction histidine kinase
MGKAEAPPSIGAGEVEGAEDDASFEPQVVAQQVSILYAQGLLPHLISVLNATILVAVLGAAAPVATRIGWLAAICLLSIGRLFLVAVYRRRRPTPAEATHWGTRFAIGIGLKGLLWGISPLLFPVRQDVNLQMLMAFVLAGMVAGANTSVGTFPRAFRAFVVPALPPMVVILASGGGRVNLAMAAMLTLYGVAMVLLSAANARTFAQNMRLQLGNARLVQRLAEGRALLECRVLERTTELRATLDEQRLAEARALRAVAARDDFLAVASHELLTPLSALQLQIKVLEHDVLLDRDNRSERLVAGLATFTRQVARMTALVDTVFRVSGLDRGQLVLDPRHIELAATVRSAVADIESGGAVVSPDCPVRLELREPVYGYWDPTRVEQIVINLVTNALKYGEGKPVTVSLDLDPHDAERVSLAVADQGCGISEAEFESIFEKFRRGQSARDRRGLGLGLFVVRELVRAMDGEISVSSMVGVGSTFRVSLPVRETGPVNGH